MHFYEYICKSTKCKHYEEPVYKTQQPKDVTFKECPLCGSALEEIRVLHRENEWYRGVHDN